MVFFNKNTTKRDENTDSLASINANIHIKYKNINGYIIP
jgi:hypothetical protein